ncbi:ROK family protein [Pseudovibrio sp. SPO723]|uniref:ROK family protein n=1 Tax=Nesiotobacter zosterae TaxID=392721 RepID=UPI0029C5C2D0|nr:ROK family protein [Pseudovibrio sp. SPO723]MDX5592886.1 ROK family protein [Pseudovibrio sp. SPO723]
MMATGGIDLGGSKIEATAFSENWQVLASRRVATPAGSFEALLDVLAEEVRWLLTHAAQDQLPIGIGTPGLKAREQGFSFAANLSGGTRNLKQELSDRIGFPIWFENDANCFALSEAMLGAGRRYSSVFGLIIGTGVGGGYVCNGTLPPDRNGACGEVGHLSIPAIEAQRLDLPLVTCGCGKTGCYETLLRGPGLSLIHEHYGGRPLSPKELISLEAAGDQLARRSLASWAELLASLVADLQVTFDPEVVIFGGGLSNLPDLTNQIAEPLSKKLLPKTEAPALCLAEHGDSSGAWGAALAARNAWAG